MPVLTVITDQGNHTVPFTPGFSVREILDATDMRVRAGCRGNGLCGLCLIQVESGQVNDPVSNELLLLSDEQIQRGIRLACLVIPHQDISIRLVNPAPKSEWKSLPFEAIVRNIQYPIQQPESDVVKLGDYMVAVDLGTTYINLSWWDSGRGKCLARRTGHNPQFRFGDDVITRLHAASEFRERAKELSNAVKNGLGEALWDISTREGFDRQHITKVLIVGNTPMLALVAEMNYELLLNPAYWVREIECRIDNRRLWASTLGLHSEATVEIVPPLAGFVGSDLLAGVLATGLVERPEAGLLMDLGTNSEMALWDGTTLWVTSAAGGPAFEGSGLSCSVPAEPGAICSVVLQGDGSLAYQTLGDQIPKGFCGSGLIDLIACLRRNGSLNRKGRLVNGQASLQLEIPRAGQMQISNRDIDIFQRAKAAIAAGVAMLLQRAHVSLAALQRVFVSGAFGRYLSVANAQAIGLLPAVPVNRVELCGNTALAGCEQLLFTADWRQSLQQLRAASKLINMADSPDFEENFMTGLFLEPMELNLG